MQYYLQQLLMRSVISLVVTIVLLITLMITWECNQGRTVLSGLSEKMQAIQGYMVVFITGLVLLLA
jgi:hypothetical protein